jgi:hypothetical protein
MIGGSSHQDNQTTLRKQRIVVQNGHRAFERLIVNQFECVRRELKVLRGDSACEQARHQEGDKKEWRSSISKWMDVQHTFSSG